MPDKKSEKIKMQDSKLTAYRPTHAEIDLGAIRYNFSQIKKRIAPHVKILVAVKANAYGHGMLEVSRALAACGVDYFGAGTVDEALQLKKARLNIPILNLTAIARREAEAIVDNNIIQTVPDAVMAAMLNNIAQKKKKKQKVHLKIDTGMGRLGIWHDEAINFINQTSKLKNLLIDGIFTHFSSADEDMVATGLQINNFLSLLKELKSAGINIKYKHAANSAAAINYNSAHLNIIRPGVMIYGLYPSLSLKDTISLKPALSLKSRISCIKFTPRGRHISYGGTYVTRKKTKIAIVPIGYGDGYNRLLSNRGEVLIREKRAPVIGRVCMDQIMVDVGAINSVKISDEVILIGRQGSESVTAEEIAVLCNTIPYEVTCWIGARVPKIYKNT